MEEENRLSLVIFFRNREEVRGFVDWFGTRVVSGTYPGFAADFNNCGIVFEGPIGSELILQTLAKEIVMKYPHVKTEILPLKSSESFLESVKRYEKITTKEQRHSCFFGPPQIHPES